MKKSSQLLDPKLWKRLYYFLSFQKTKHSLELSIETKLNPQELSRWLLLMKNLKAPLHIQGGAGLYEVSPLGEEEVISQSWSWQNWMKLNVLMEEIEVGDVGEDLKSVAASIRIELMKHKDYAKFQDFKNRVLTLEQIHLNNHESIMGKIEQAMLDIKALKIATVQGDKEYLIKPSKLLFLEGQLSIVGEDRFDKCLTAVRVDDILECALVDCWKSSVSENDIESFVRGIRNISDLEERLILKIKNPSFFDVQPAHHFLIKPCMITNPVGDLIWSAYVEIGPPLFDWLITLESQVEVLDPQSIKEKYFKYCEEKFKKMA